MRVFVPSVDEGHEWVAPVDDAHFHVLRTLGEEKIATQWQPTPVRLITVDENGDRLQEADMPWLGSHALVLRKRALDVLGDVLREDSEFLPLANEEAELWLVHVWRTVASALDPNRSEIVRFPSSGRIMKVGKPRFRPEVLNGFHCFKLREFPRGPTYVTDEIVTRADDALLSGARFRQVWDSE
jgi:hypothetical protein